MQIKFTIVPRIKGIIGNARKPKYAFKYQEKTKNKMLFDKVVIPMFCINSISLGALSERKPGDIYDC